MIGAIYDRSSTLRALGMPTLHYHVAMPDPSSHLFEVTLRVQNWPHSQLDVHFPVWTPGSYLVREYARHLQDFGAWSDDRPLSWEKVTKSQWRIQVPPDEPQSPPTAPNDRPPETPAPQTITLFYRVFALDLTVRTNHLDLTHGYFNPGALLMYVPDCCPHPHRVTIVPPDAHWQVATALPAVPEDPLTFVAADYDTLVDSPFEIGIQRRMAFEVQGKPHEWVIWGDGPIPEAELVADTQAIIEAEAAIFGGLPYDRYVFLLHLSANGFGGLEHRDSCTLNYPRLGLRSGESYQRFMRLVAHEFFHLWNVKRLRPKGLETFDYSQENYTSCLWFCEGTTSYYDRVIPWRSGLATPQEFLDLMAQDITRHQTTPGRLVQPLAESSFDAWIKLYRRDAHSNNNQMSYYLKGELVTFLLDLKIRAASQNQRSFDQVLQQLWQQFGNPETGYTETELKGIIESVAGYDLSDFFHWVLETTAELPFAEALEPFGLELTTVPGKWPDLGLTVSADRGHWVIQSVTHGGPAQRAGLEPGDELLAWDGLRLREGLDDRLKYAQPGDVVTLAAFHQDVLESYALTLGDPQPQAYRLGSVAQPTASQLALRQGWLG